jgi:hypothetical protein
MLKVRQVMAKMDARPCHGVAIQVTARDAGNGPLALGSALRHDGGLHRMR